MKLCDRSPSFFPVACADVYDRDSCAMVKTRGYCQKFPTSMRTTCGITCNLCGESIYNTIISTICLSLIRQGAITSLSAYLKFVSLRTDSHEGSGTRVNVCEIRVGDRANLREVLVGCGKRTGNRTLADLPPAHIACLLEKCRLCHSCRSAYERLLAFWNSYERNDIPAFWLLRRENLRRNKW